MGVTLRTPSVALWNEGRVRVSSLIAAPLESFAIYGEGANDGKVFAYQHPAHLGSGLAYQTTDWEMELAGEIVHGGPTYTNLDGFTSAFVTFGSGGLVVTPGNIPASTSNPQTAWNISLAGSLRLRDRLHLLASGFTDRSPYENSDIFTLVDIYGGSVGARMTDDFTVFEIGFIGWASGRNQASIASFSGINESVDIRLTSLGVVLGSRFQF